MHHNRPQPAWARLATFARWLNCDPSTLRADIRRGVLRAGKRPLHYADDRPRAHGNERRRWIVYQDDAQAYVDKIRAGTRLPIGLFRKR